MYILDDGKDASKKAWVKNLGEDRVVYIPGHIKGENEINGKAHNLNNALGMIYPPGHEIPLEEVSCSALDTQPGSYKPTGLRSPAALGMILARLSSNMLTITAIRRSLARNSYWMVETHGLHSGTAGAASHSVESGQPASTVVAAGAFARCQGCMLVMWILAGLRVLTHAV